MFGAMKSAQRDVALDRLSDLVSLLPVLEMPAKAAREYGQIRAALESRGETIGGNDLWIAAHARSGSRGGYEQCGRVSARARTQGTELGWLGLTSGSVHRMNLATVEMKAFVPATDFERSKDFYQALGFKVPWASEDLAYVHCGDTSFLLQAFNEPDFCRNFQMHLLVEDVDAWHAHALASGVEARFGAKIGALADQPWAMRDFALVDPSGVLWRIATNLPREEEK